ncbi:MAG: hypothetical protein FWE49_07045, partial [Synergistaceae bacterium]|nr:hypothetical protein [Synergistaceae bacterium]
MKNYFAVLKYIKKKGYNCWLIGSAVRDIIMKRVPVALTMVVDAPSYEALTEDFGGEIVNNRNYNYVQSEIFGESSQMSLLDGRTIEEELAERDFTINAIAIRWDGFYVDPFRGRRDIRNGLVRIVNDNVENLESKPLRVARLIRFAVFFDMNIYWKSEMDARIFIETHKEEITDSLSSRWGREIFIGMKEKPHDVLCLADHYGLTPLLIPKLEHLKGIEIPDGGTLFSHTLDTLKEIQNYFEKRNAMANDLAIALAGLFHHIGSTPGIPVDTKVSSEITKEYLKLWGAPDNVIEKVLTVMHDYRLFYTERSELELCRFALDNGMDTIRSIAEFCLCNINASVGANAAKSQEIIV